MCAGGTIGTRNLVVKNIALLFDLQTYSSREGIGNRFV
jgi:hypothetical protein